MQNAIEEAQRSPLGEKLGLIGAAIVIIIVGIIRLTSPEFVFELEMGLKIRNGEPSDFFLVGTRISGAIIIVVGLVILISGIFC